MKLLARYLKPFVGILLVCLVLLFGQAACDLSLPTLMSDMVNVGIQQSGLEAGAPEAMRQEGLQLLSAFAGEEDRSLLEGGYYTIEPGSSEAQRFAEDYPLVREEAVCVLREGQTQEELDALEGAYNRASYAMLLYFQQAAESGDLEQAAQSLAQSQLPTVEAPLPDGQTGLEGSQESFLQGALPEESSQAESDAGAPTLYSSQGDSAGEVDSTAAQEPVENTAPAGETSQESQNRGTSRYSGNAPPRSSRAWAQDKRSRSGKRRASEGMCRLRAGFPSRVVRSYSSSPTRTSLPEIWRTVHLPRSKPSRPQRRRYSPANREKHLMVSR